MNLVDSTLAPGLRGGPGDALLWVRDLRKRYPAHGGGSITAVDGVSFDIRPGETFGLVGESGCGKSTVARCVLRLTGSGGEIVFEGQPIQGLNRAQMRPLRRQMQIMFQDPYATLDPRMTVEEIVREPLDIHQVGTPAERRQRVQAALEQVGIPPQMAARKPHAFSGGQRQRIGLARALVLDPRLVILDEPVSALDVSIQAQVLNLLRSLQQQMGLTYLFIVHDLAVAEYFCDRVAVMYLGAIMEIGPSERLFQVPLHPYTVTLLSAVPVPAVDAAERRQRIILPGEARQQPGPARGCRFRARCPVGHDRDICAEVEPPLAQHTPDQWAACHFPGELGLNSQ